MEKDPDVICLTETKCDKDMLNQNLYNVDKYNIIRKDRKSQNAPGRGVAILVRKNLTVDETSVAELNSFEGQESVWCEIRNKNGKDIIIGTVYRPPSASVECNDRICELLRKCEELSGEKQILVCGDFNMDNILWEENRIQEGSPNLGQASKLLDVINDCFWVQNVSEWTHMRNSESASRLDLVFSKTDGEVEDLTYLAPLGKSKHAVLCCNVAVDRIPEEQECKLSKLNYHKADLNKMKTLFKDAEWNSLYQAGTASEKWEIFTGIYNRTVKACVPTFKCRRSSPKPKWMNRELQQLIHRKQQAWKKYRERKCAARRNEYNAIRNSVTRAVRATKYNYEKRVATDTLENPKHFWAYVRSKTSVKENITHLRNDSGTLTDNDNETANVMNKAFNQVFVREDVSQPVPVPTTQFQGVRVEDIQVTRADIRKRLQDLNPDKAPGPDGVSPFILKECAEMLCDPLHDIFYVSVETGDVPQDW